MAESHDIRVNVDASAAKSSLKELGAAISSVGSALKTLQAPSGGGFDKLSAQVGELSSGFNKLKSIGSLGNVSREITQLSTAVRGLQGPSAASIAGINNLARAARGLSGINVNAKLGADLSSIARAANSIKVNAATTKNFTTFLSSLNGVKIDPQLSKSIAQIGNGMGNLKMPSSATLTALQKLITIMSSGNASAVGNMARSLNTIQSRNFTAQAPRQQGGGGAPAAGAGGAGGRGAGGPPPGAAGAWANLGSALQGYQGRAHAVTGEMRGLENAFSASYQAASLFRTAIGAITLGELTSSILQAGNELLTFKIGLDSVATSATEGGEHLKFIKDLAENTGGPLASMIPTYQQFAAAVRSIGKSADEAQATFRGFQFALSANHVSVAGQAREMTELMETFAMGGGHAQQVMRSMTKSIPALAGVIQETLHIDGAELEKKFKEGGIKPDEMIKIGKALGEKYAAGVEEGLSHSQSAINRFENRFTEMKQVIFDSGFDSGLSNMMNTLTKALDSAGVEDIGKKIGEGFREGFAALGVFGQALIENRETILTVVEAAGALAAAMMAKTIVVGLANTAWGILNGTWLAVSGTAGVLTTAVRSLGLLFTPMGVGLLAVGAAAFGVYTYWEQLKESFTGGEGVFGAVGSWVGGLKDKIMDLVDACIKGAAAWGAFFSSLSEGKSFGDALQDMRSKLEELGPASGQKLQESLAEGAKTAAEKAKASWEGVIAGLGDSFAKIMPDFGKYGEQFRKSMQDNKPKDFEGHGDHEANAANEARKKYEDSIKMSDAGTKLYEKLVPSIKATADIAKNIKEIDDMLGKKAPDGHFVSEADVERLKEIAKYEALPKIDPAAGKIRDLMEEVQIEKQLAGKSNKDNLEIERKILEEQLALKKQGLELTKAEADAYRALLKAQQDLKKGGSDPFTQWANSQKSAADQLEANIKSGMDSVADGISKIVTEGKGKFKSLGDAIRAELRSVLKGIASNFIKAGIKDVMAQAIKGMNLGDGGSSIAKALGLGGDIVKSANKKIDDAAKGLADKTTEQMNVQAAVVNINGAPMGGTNPNGLGSNQAGVTAADVNGNTVGSSTTGMVGSAPANLGADYKPGTGFGLGGFNSNSVGGTQNLDAATGTNAALAALGGNAGRPNELAALPAATRATIAPTFGSNVSTIAPQSIPRNSASLFGADLTKLTPQAPAPAPVTGASFALPKPAVDQSRTGSLGSGAGGSNETKILQQLMNEGASPKQAATLAADFKGESSYNPRGVSPNDAGPGKDSIGLAMWNRKRSADMQASVSGMAGKPYSQISPDDLMRYQTTYAHREAQTQYGSAWRAIDSTPDGSRKFHHAFEGFDEKTQNNTPKRDAWEKQLEQKANALHGQHSSNAGIDSTPTGSINDTGTGRTNAAVKPAQMLDQNQIKTMTQKYTTDMNAATKDVSKTFSKDMDSSAKDISKTFQQDMSQSKNSGGAGFGNVGTGASSGGGGDAGGGLGGDASGAMSAVAGLASSVAKLGGSSKGAASAITSMIPSITKLLTSLLGGLGGGAGGAAGGAGGLLGGLFSEGGYSGSPVGTAAMPASFWAGAPHYAEGTPNTSGGMPAILHDNEAVVPLSRGRSIPVQLPNGGSNVGQPPGSANKTTNMHVNIQTKDHDSFRLNKSQVQSEMQKAMGRMAARNN
jgi:hypothetical protein